MGVVGCVCGYPCVCHPECVYVMRVCVNHDLCLSVTVYGCVSVCGRLLTEYIS